MKRLLQSLVISMFAAASVAQAQVQLEVVDRHTGQTLREYRQGDERWIAGLPGHRYAINLRNRSSQRVLAVVSVDGVNVITGDTARPDQSGYVLEPWASTEIKGWRKSMRDVAAFEFVALPDSYAARTGRPDNVGVIGVAVFAERTRPAIALEDYRSRGPAAEPGYPGGYDKSAPSTQADDFAGRQELGTGHGRREGDRARYVEFERASSRPSQILRLYYDDPQRLIAMGLMPNPYRYRPGIPQRPSAFPGFVPDPDPYPYRYRDQIGRPRS
ncbi:MAG: hypothetical protein KDI71_01300 [Xanthomonadales bacterium]|nr:hypothetical protein [Xanthomonadales bacterium]